MSAEADRAAADDLEAKIRALAPCNVDPAAKTQSSVIDNACPTFAAADDWKRVPENFRRKELALAVGAKLLDDAAPAVRAFAALVVGEAGVSRMTDTRTGVTKFSSPMTADQTRALVARTRVETDPGVVVALVFAIGTHGGRSPEVRDALLALAAHDRPEVRALAARQIASTMNQGMTGGADKLADMLERDPDRGVRMAVCEDGGALGAEVLRPLYERLSKPGDDPAFAAACLHGLTKMWASFPLFDTHDERAYQITLERLATAPRSEDYPAWDYLMTLKWLSSDDSPTVKDWRKEAPWFDPAALRKALVPVILDPAASELVRERAVDVAVAQGATRADLEAWKKALGKSRRDARIASTIDEELAKMK